VASVHTPPRVNAEVQDELVCGPLRRLGQGGPVGSMRSGTGQGSDNPEDVRRIAVPRV
jgi:hypothetical protein